MQSAAYSLRTDRRYRIQIGNYYCNCFRKHGWRRYCGNFIGKRRKGYKRSHNYYEKEFADGILIFKADGYYCNYYKEIRFVRCFGKLNSGTKQFRAE